MEMDVLLNKEKPIAAAEIRAECSQLSKHELINSALDYLLDPSKDVDSEDNIEWCRWLIAGGTTPEEFSSTVRRYDKATSCNTIWTADCVAYRCRTCGISQCMSLCTECFHHGNHEGHDFIMFRSETGGACDCGETNVVKKSGCCSLHCPKGHEHSQTSLQSQNPHPSAKILKDPIGNNSNEQTAPPELLCVANAMMPRLFLRLIQHMRLQENNSTEGLTAGTKFISMLKGLSEMGAPMRQVMTHALTNPQIYKNLTEEKTSFESELEKELQLKYTTALESIPVLNLPAEFQDILALRNYLEHKTFLEELIFWTAKSEFPEDLICLLLSLRPDNSYKEAFTKAFVLHYGLISQLLVRSANPEIFSTRVVTVSVQIFSVEQLSLQMVESMQLLHVILLSLRQMIDSTAVPVVNPDNSEEQNSKSLKLVNCDDDILTNNYYASLKSDLNEILSHTSVAVKLLEDDTLLEQWFDLISMFQAMNPNRKIGPEEEHMEFESTTYISAITAELEICSTIMWAILSHLKDSCTADLNRKLIGHCWKQLKKWTNSSSRIPDKKEISFHLPLHRSFSRFIHQGVSKQNLNLIELLPEADEFMKTIEIVVKLQAAFYQIISGQWVRNGNHILHQASHYIGSMCCNSMVDADIFLLQISMVNISKERFLRSVISEFGMDSLLKSLNTDQDMPQEFFQQKNMTLENFLNFLAIITSVRTNVGISEEELLAIELTTLLCKGDRTHSQLMELMPERCGHGHGSQMKNFEKVLAQVADFQAPRFEQGGTMTQGIYAPKTTTWQTLYDPIYVLLRSSHKSDFQIARDRFTDHLKKNKLWNGVGNLWPPFRIPKTPPHNFCDTRKLLTSRIIHQIIFNIIYEAVHFQKLSDNIVALAVYILEIILSTYEGMRKDDENMSSEDIFDSIYNSDDFFENIKKFVKPQENRQKEESMISLLLKLHSQLSGVVNSFSFTNCVKDIGNRNGNGDVFIGSLLSKICLMDESCKNEILRAKNRIWPATEISKEEMAREAEEKEKEKMRRRIKERKMQIISEFAKKGQKYQISEFSENIKEDDIARSSIMSPTPEEIEFDCVICLQSSANCEDNPFGLVTFLNSSKVIGNRKLCRGLGNFSLSANLYRDLGEERMQEYKAHFDTSSVLMSTDGGFNGGVYVQTCGHYLHMNCLNSYLASLNPNEKKQKMKAQFVKRDYRCPLCRKLANSFLPMVKGNCKRSGKCDNSSEISNLLRKRSNNFLGKNILESVNQFTTELKTIYSQIVPLADFNSAYSFAFFLTSTLNYNLELELSFRASNSLNKSRELTQLQLLSTSSTMAISKSIPPLLNALKVNYKSMSTGHGRHIAQLWEACNGSRIFRNSREVPILLRDSNALLLHFILQLPMDISTEVYSKIVQGLYNLTIIQLLCTVALHFQQNDRKKILLKYLPTELHIYLGIILSKLETACIFCEQKNVISLVDVESHVIKSVLPFLRMAVLIRSHIFQEPSPMAENQQNIDSEFKMLAQSLQLGSKIVLVNCDSSQLKSDRQFNVFECSSVKAENFLSWNSDAKKIISAWCQHLSEYLIMTDKPNFLIQSQNISWDIPKLIELPKDYNELFQFYLTAQCKNCKMVPTDPNICMMCGTLVCMKNICCQNPNSGISEVIEHSVECGAGTALFLSTLTSCITIVRGRKACSWGSVYLDSFGEEDPGLRRGKPLFLCQERFSLLEQLWLTHSFDNNTSCRWFWHRDLL